MKKITQYHLDFIYKWLRYKEYIDLNAVLKNLSFNNIAIYGGGGIGELLYEYLYESDIKVECIIDNNPDISFPYDVEIMLPQQFIASNICVDAIIITALSHTIEIVSDFTSVDCEVISLEQFIIDIDFLHYMYEVVEYIENRNSRLYLFDWACPVERIKNRSLAELNHIVHKAELTNLLNFGKAKPELLRHYYDDLPYVDDKYINNVFVTPLLVEKNGLIFLQDMESEYFNVINGLRYTSDNPEVFDNTIHFFGNCLPAGHFAEDRLTAESYLQRFLNTMPIHNKTYRVLNHGVYGSKLPTLIDQCKRIRSTELINNDIVLLFSDYFYMSGIEYYIQSDSVNYQSIVSAFDRPHDMGETFFDRHHTNHRGYKLLAEKLYKILSEPFTSMSENLCNNIFIRDFVLQNNKEPQHTKSSDINMYTLDKYISFLLKEKVSCTGVIGAIVMNCNPFTLGHRYLIEQALSKCAYLYVFVVEEDKSFFSFQDRIALVKAGTDDLQNVKVIPGGNYIISSTTFPEYFVKETNPNIKIDASKDVTIFANDITPALDITVRFVGEEPLDPITNQYNKTLKDILPEHGINVIEIPRMQTDDGAPISASYVRKLLTMRNFEEIAKIVPKTTLDFLRGKY